MQFPVSSSLKSCDPHGKKNSRMKAQVERRASVMGVPAEPSPWLMPRESGTHECACARPAAHSPVSPQHWKRSLEATKVHGGLSTAVNNRDRALIAQPTNFTAKELEVK